MSQLFAIVVEFQWCLSLPNLDCCFILFESS